MKLSISCPESIRLHLGEDVNNHPAEGVTVAIAGGLISFEIAGDTLDERIAVIRDLDAWIGIAIADEDRPDQIQALTALKRTVAEVERLVIRESSYSDAMHSSFVLFNEGATVAVDISHSHAEQNTSTDNSSEQHGVAPQNEETENEQASEEGGVEAAE